METVGCKPAYKITRPHTFFPSKAQYYEYRICFLKISKYFFFRKLLSYILQILTWRKFGFAKLRRATISFVMSVRLSNCMGKLGFHWKNFHEIWYLIIFRKSVEKIQISLKSDKNNEYFTWWSIYVFDHISLKSS